MKRAAFLDRDGVINLDTGYVHRREDFHFLPGVLAAASALVQAGWSLVIVTNQSGIGRGYYTEADFLALEKWMEAQFAAAHAPISGAYFCPDHPEAALPQYRRVSPNRKPAPGMFLQAAQDLGLDLGASVCFGDSRSDMQAAQNAGVPLRILLGSNAATMPQPVPEASGLAQSLTDALTRYPALLEPLS